VEGFEFIYQRGALSYGKYIYSPALSSRLIVIEMQCATVIRWAGFKEAIYSTSAKTLRKQGWPQMDISIEEVFARSKHLKSETRLVKHVLANESDSYFAWQFDAKGACPNGCGRSEDGNSCVPGEDGEAKNDEL